MATRPIDITLINNSNVIVKFGNAHAVHGTKPKVTKGSETLKTNGGQCTVHAEEKDPIVGPGPQGSFSFDFQDESGRAFNFDYNHPMGTGETYVHVKEPPGYTDKMTENHLAHHKAYCTIELLKLGK